jgi:hypothetical protein
MYINKSIQHPCECQIDLTWVHLTSKWMWNHISPFDIHVDVEWAFHKHVEWTKLSLFNMNNACCLSKCALYIADMTFHTRCFMFHENNVLMTLACHEMSSRHPFCICEQRVVAISVCCYVGIEFHQLLKLQKYSCISNAIMPTYRMYATWVSPNKIVFKIAQRFKQMLLHEKNELDKSLMTTPSSALDILMMWCFDGQGTFLAITKLE